MNTANLRHANDLVLWAADRLEVLLQADFIYTTTTTDLDSIACQLRTIRHTLNMAFNQINDELPPWHDDEKFD